MRRFKTGTPARIYRDSIDFSKMEIQLGDNSDRFSFMSPRSTFVEEPCYLTYTNEKRTKSSSTTSTEVRFTTERFCR